MGYDQPRKLGDRETGGGLALPIWINYMSYALRGVPDYKREIPPGVVNEMGEFYYAETRPGQGIATIGITEGGVGTGEQGEQVREQVF